MNNEIERFNTYKKAEQLSVVKETKLKIQTQNKIKRYFFKGPVPLSWLTIACSLHKRTISTALTLWHLYELNKRSPQFKFSYAKAKEFDLNKISAWRGLSDLEALNLIKVQRKNGKCPMVSIVLPVVKNDDF